MGVTKRYVLSLPERVVRSVLGLGASVTRQLSEVALPAGVRRSQIYQGLVDRTLRFLIEQVGGAEGLYSLVEHYQHTLSENARGRLYEVRPPATRAVRHGSCSPVFAPAATFTGALLDKLDRRT
jgi:hypothetical protein